MSGGEVQENSSLLEETRDQVTERLNKPEIMFLSFKIKCYAFTILKKSKQKSVFEMLGENKKKAYDWK